MAQYLGGNIAILQEALRPLHEIWDRATMSGEGEALNGQIADVMIRTWT